MEHIREVMERVIQAGINDMKDNGIFILAGMKYSYLHGAIDVYMEMPDCDLSLVNDVLDAIEADRMRWAKTLEVEKV